jgi:formate dehydrogenase beta subunit
LSEVYFSTWNNELINNTNSQKQEWKKSQYNLPLQYDIDREASAFVGWDGVCLFNPEVDVITLAMKYAMQYQEYSQACGRCAPGRWGGRILYDLLDKIARGEGEISDLQHLKEVAKNMQSTAKCEIGRTVPKPILDLMIHFEDIFLTCINNKTKAKDYEKNVEYIAKITAPCMDACPSHVDIPGYIEGVRDLRMDDSLKATRKTMPLAHVCGRVCPHPCEDACRRANLDESISIMELKRIGAEYEANHGFDFFHPIEKKSSIGKKVAVIGSGPAGLTSSYYLSAEGVSVDVYEALPILGGEVAVGVPEYRMPVEKYNRDIALVKDMGVNFITNSKITANDMIEFEKNYDSIMISVGTRLSKAIHCENEREEIKGYWGAIDMLDQVNLWKKYGIGKEVDLTGKTVVCVGGGFTSMDVVRCAVRANAKKVYMIYRRDEQTIIRNTTYEEYHEAVEEGVEFLFHSAVNKIVDEEDELKSLLIDKYELIPDENGGRDKLLKIEGESYEIEADFIIPAVSQSANLDLLPKEWNINLTSWGTIKTNGKDFMTSRRGVFTAGDCEYGPMTIVNAVGQAKRASSVMSRYLKTGEITLNNDEIMEDHLRKLRVYDKQEKVTGWLAGLPRNISKKLHVDERKDNHKEVNLGFTQQEAINESQRCMRCYYISMVAI